MSDKPVTQQLKWRVGSKVALNVYESDRPMFQCHTPEDARRVVDELNKYQQVSGKLIECMRERDALVSAARAIGCPVELREDVMKRQDPLWAGRDPLYGNAPKYYPAAVPIDSEKLVALRDACGADTMSSTIESEPATEGETMTLFEVTFLEMSGHSALCNYDQFADQVTISTKPCSCATKQLDIAGAPAPEETK